MDIYLDASRLGIYPPLFTSPSGDSCIIYIYIYSTIKLILWEQLIDSVGTGLSYHFNILTIHIFDGDKFGNSNELTTVEPIDDITIHVESPEKKRVTSRTMYCHSTLIRQHHALHAIKFNQLIMRKSLLPLTTLASVFQTKLVSQMMIKTDHSKLENFTCFNDAIQSFFALKCPTAISE